MSTMGEQGAIVTMSSTLHEYVRRLAPDARIQYAARVGVSDQTIRFWVPPRDRPPMRLPQSPEHYYALADASQGRVSRTDVLRHFFPEAFDVDG